MHRLPPWYAPKAARIDLGRPRGTRVDRRTPFTTTGNAEEAGGFAVGIIWKSLYISAVGTLGLAEGY
jgi:hypothetical protein